jgi:predicted NAD/FAD-binding protein
MKIAVVGSGISGLSCAYRLAQASADVTLFEAGDYFGGHSNTVDVTVDGARFGVDTGFLVFNERTYPNLVSLFDELGVDTAPSDMSFSVKLPLDGGGALEWAAASLDTVFAQRANLVRPRFLHAGRHPSLQPRSRRAGAGCGGARRRPRRLARRTRLQRPVPQLVPVADGRLYLVLPVGPDAGIPAVDLRALLP